MIPYPNRIVSSLIATCGRLAVAVTVLVGILASTIGHAETSLKLTASAPDASGITVDPPSRLPTIVLADSAPLRGEIELAGKPAIDPSAPAATSDPTLKLSITFTSMLDQRVVERAELTSSSPVNAAATAPGSNANTQPEHWDFRLTQPLPSGVYELKLEPTVSVTSRFRELLPWERSAAKNHPETIVDTCHRQAWTLIVLPTASSDLSTAAGSAKSIAAPRRLWVHWSGFAEMLADAELLTTSSHSSSPFSWMLTGSGREPMTPAQRWAGIMERIDARLDAIHAAQVTRIVIDPLATDPTLNVTQPDMMLLQCLHAKAAQLGIEIWQLEPSAEPASPTFDDPNAEQLTLVRVESWPRQSTVSQPLRVAPFLRPSSQTIRGQFPADMHPAANADLIWFGVQTNSNTSAPRDVLLQDTDTPSTAPTNVYPLANQPAAFNADAWLADWAAFCIRNTTSSATQGLIVDETLLRDEVAAQRWLVLDAARVWQICWSDDSRWLTNSRVAEKSNASGASNRSLVQVRHANVGNGTTLVCLNQAPWPMRVRLPLANLVRWAGEASSELGRVQLTNPAVNELGSTIIIPASSMIICHAEQPISPTMQFTAEADDARRRVAEVTRQVTTIVENLGILGELAGMTSRPNSTAQRLAGSPHSRSNHAIVRQASAIRTPSTQSESSAPTSGGSSFWSTERWGLGRAVTSISETTSSLAHKVSVSTTAEDGRPNESVDGESFRSRRTVNTECRNLLGNGGFELPHEIGVPGWMHAHHPPSAVEIDTLIRSEGRQSIRLEGKTDAGASAWLISREIARPIAGRLGISMSLRGEPPRLSKDQDESAKSIQAGEPIEIRVAIEGERDGQSIRHSQSVQVPRNGKWNTGRFVMEWLDVDPLQDRNLHITIDNLSTSTVWIDDIVVTDYFASAAERSDLQSLAYLAVQGLQHSDLQPAANLLKNFWAKDLLRIADFQASAIDDRSATLARARNEPETLKPRSERGKLAPVWGTDAPVVTPMRRTPPNAVSTSQLPPLPPAPPLPARQLGEATDGSISSDSPNSIGGKIRSWLPPPLKF